MVNRTAVHSYNKRITDWVLLQSAASNDPPEPVRSYDRRYHHPDLTRERVCAEALQAAALALEYTGEQPAAVQNAASLPEQTGHVLG